MILSVSNLFSKEGATEIMHGTFSEVVSLPNETLEFFRPQDLFSGTFNFFRLDDDVVVVIENGILKGVSPCAKCLQEMETHVMVTNAEQIFYSKRQKGWGEESFSINHKNLTIDLSDFFRQEVLIRIPEAPVHREGDCDKKMLEKISEHLDKGAPSPFAEIKDILGKAGK